jgi:hypothetical protein
MAFTKPRLILQRGTRSAQPDAADPLVAEGTLYAVTDESVVERSNGSAWESFIASGGDVYGPGSGTVDDTLVRWNGTGGALVQGSSTVLDDSNNLSGINTLTVSGSVNVSGTTQPAMTLTQGTLTDPATGLSLTATWNDASDTFVGLDVNITNTTSAAASRLLRLQVGGTERFAVSSVGTDRVVASVTSTLNLILGSISGTTADLYLNSAASAIRLIAATSADIEAGARLQFFGNSSAFPGQFFCDTGANDSAAFVVRSAATGIATRERIRWNAFGHMIFTELQGSETNPTTSQVASIAGSTGQVAIYSKSTKLIFAYNNGGTMTYISIPLDGSTTTWTHNTTAP